MGLFVYALCALTSLACFVLLLRQHRRSYSPLVFQSSLAFLCFAASNVLLFVDFIVFPQIDLRLWRNLTTLAGVLVLLLAVTKDGERNGR